MEKIIEKLEEWKHNTDIDIKSDWIDEKDKQEYLRQSSQLAMAIGLLNGIGINNNIPE